MTDEPQDIEQIIVNAIEDARDGTLEERRRKEIQQLLVSSPDARRFYLKHNQLTRMLASDDLPLVASDEAVEASRSFGDTATEHSRDWRRKFAYIGWLAAAALLVTVIFVVSTEDSDTGPEIALTPVDVPIVEPPVAILTRAVNVTWQHPRRFRSEIGRPITDGSLRIESGIAEIAFASGATVTIEGPAKLRIDSAMKCFSHNGKLTANCPPSAHGFMVRFRGGRVIDLGTEFALNTEPEGRTEVHVLNGEVIVALTGDDEKVLQEQNLKGNSAVALSPGETAISAIDFNAEPYTELQRDALIRSQPIKLQFDLGHRAGLYSGTNSPAHATGDMLPHENVWTQIVGDQSGVFVMADSNICPHPIRVDYGHGDGVIDWDAAPVDPTGRIWNKAEPFFNTALCQDHRPWDFDLGLRVAGLPKGTYRIYALCRSIRRPTAAYDVSFGVNLERQVEQPQAVPPMESMEGKKWKQGLTYVTSDVEVSSAEDWVTFITRYSRKRSIRTTPHHGRSLLLGLQIVEIRK